MVVMETHSHTRLDRETDRQAMPGAVRRAVFAAVGLALVGALYLVAVRGEALLLDLSALGRIFCF
jgi:hypothetical protein